MEYTDEQLKRALMSELTDRLMMVTHTDGSTGLHYGK